MDGSIPGTDVNSSAPVSSPEVQQSQAVPTPPAENAGSAQAAPQASGPNQIPYPRFQEVVHQKNEYAGKIEDLERRLKAYESHVVQSQSSNVVNDAISRLVAAGLDQNAAKLLVETQMAVLDHRMGEKIGPLEQRTVRHEVDNWIRDFSKTHSDYYELEPKMEQEFARMPPHYQRMIAADPNGIEMLYWKVKGQHTAAQAGQARVAGATEAYNNMAQKAAMSSTPGRPVGSNALTRQSIAAMSPDEYSRRRSEIADAMRQGKLA